MTAERGSRGGLLEDAAWLHGEYVDKGRSVTSIGEELGVPRKRARRALDEAGIQRRAPGGSTAEREARMRLRDRDWLRSKLHGEGLSLVQVADELGVSQAAVSYWLGQHGLRAATTAERIEGELARALSTTDGDQDPVGWLRRRHVDWEWSWAEISAALDRQVSPRRLRRLGVAYGFAQTRPGGRSLPAQARARLADPAWLAHRYHQQGATMRDIAAELGVAMVTVERAVRRADIPRRRRGPRSQPS